MKIKQVAITLLLLWLDHTQSQDSNCDFYQYVESGSVYYVMSPSYQRNYTPGVQCRWVATCPADSNCRLDCPLIQLPESKSCTQDRLLISRTGDPQLSSAVYYCGQGSLSGIVSTGRQISVGLITPNNSTGGRLLCQVTAQVAGSPPTTCSCGYKRTNRIVGGEVTKVNEYPMMAGIAYVELSSIKCGAVIISQKHVVTAAHCMVQRTTANTAVIVGEHDVTTGSETSATQGLRIENILIHPQYTPSNYDYDISLVSVVGSITFSEFVGPVCLPFKFAGASFAGSNVTMLGWGTVSFGGMTSNQLRKVDVGVISQTQCQSSYSTLTSRQMCTYAPGKDACQDDSGGPLLYNDRSTGRLFNVGIISYGRSCAGRDPGISARVTTLLDWIVANTASVTLCRVA